MGKTEKGDFTPAKEPRSVIIARIQEKMLAKIEWCLDHETGPTLAAAIKAGLELKKEAPAPKADNIKISINVIGEDAEEKTA